MEHYKINTDVMAKSSRQLSRYLDKTPSSILLQLDDDVIELPFEAANLLQDILAHMADGQKVVVMPEEEALTTQQAADILHVSHQYFIQLLKKDALPYHKMGTHRRLFLRDVLAYREQVDSKRLQTLEKLTQQAQELHMGY